jgi:DNA-binding transcriptional LysR family regulator
MADRLEAMRAFVAVCEAHGFSAAARRLGWSPAAVTRLIASLEDRLGIRLLQRTTRTVKLTDAGGRFLERARRILAEVEEAERSAQDERAEPRGRLVVAAPLLFGRMHVAPLVSRFLQQCPQAGADLQLSDRFVSLVEEGIDIAIRIGHLADSGLVVRRLGRTRRVLVASPAYLAAHRGAPQHPSELKEHSLIAFRSIAAGQEWTFQGPRGNHFHLEVDPRFATNSGDAAINHAAGGGGITAAFCYQVDSALRAGTLVEVLRAFSPPAVPIQAVFPTSRLLSNKVRAFLSLAEGVAPTWQFVASSE